MSRWTAWLLCALVLIASVQCFASCVDDSCASQHSCHRETKVCGHQELVADDLAVSAPHFTQMAAMSTPVIEATSALAPEAAVIRPLVIFSPPPLSSSIAVLKI